MLELDTTALALVCQGFETKFDQDNSSVQVQVSREKKYFMSSLCKTPSGFARLYVYQVADLNQDIKQYEAVLKSSMFGPLMATILGSQKPRRNEEEEFEYEN